MESKYDEKRIKANILSLLNSQFYLCQRKALDSFIAFPFIFHLFGCLPLAKELGLPTYLVLCCFG